MYRTCAFCNGKLDGDGGPTDLGVGRRLAFDEWKGRLWVICPRCSRWNLAPLDDRLERIEALARAASDGRVAAATDEVALIRWHGYDLVRVGKPRRLELATWRYGERLRARRWGSPWRSTSRPAGRWACSCGTRPGSSSGSTSRWWGVGRWPSWTRRFASAAAA